VWFALLLGTAALAACSTRDEPGAIHLVVEQRLMEPLAASLAQLTADLEAEGYAVTVDGALTSAASPDEIRARLQQRRRDARQLRGAILVGELAAPLYNVASQQGDPYWHDHLVDLYYMDLDGEWSDTDGNGVLDTHRAFRGGLPMRALSWLAARLPLGLDRRDPEIWVSRIRAGTLEPLGDEIALYEDYFARNHAYRTGGELSAPKRAFVSAAVARFSTSGWGARPAQLYDEVETRECTFPAAEPLRELLKDPRGWALGIVGSFSGPQAHKFHVYEGGGYDEDWFDTLEGRRILEEYSLLEHAPWDVTSREVAALAPHVLFYQILSSETGRHDQTGYLGGAYLFFGWGLAVIAGTQHSGAIGVPVLYDELERGMTIGESWRRAIAWSIRNAGATLEFQWCDRAEPYDPSVDVYKAVLLGDGTLHLPRGRR
jgi:hypothetical protein